MREQLDWTKGQKAMEISFEELQTSSAVRNSRGEYSKTLPMKHSDLIHKLYTRVASDYNVTVGNIFVPKNRIGVIDDLDPDHKYLIKGAVIHSLIAEIKFDNLLSNEMNFKLAINITDKGVTLAQGTNVSVCSNMTILGAQNIITTQGRNGLPFDKFMELFESWVPRMAKTYEKYEEVVNKMKSVMIGSGAQIYELIGELQIAAIRNNYERGYYAAPLNLSELSKFSQELIQKPIFLEEEPMSLWDLFNGFTYVQTHSEQNIDTKIEDMIRVSNFLLDKYYPDGNSIWIN